MMLRFPGKLSPAGALELGAFAVLVRGGMRLAAVLVDQGGRGAPLTGVSSGASLLALSNLPGVLVLLAFLELARATRKEELRRVSLWYFGVGLVHDVVSLVLSSDSDPKANLLVVAFVLVLLEVCMTIWFALVVNNLRHQIGPLAVLLALTELVGVIAWVVTKVALFRAFVLGATGGPEAPLTSGGIWADQFDLVRAFVFRTAAPLAIFTFLMAACSVLGVRPTMSSCRGTPTLPDGDTASPTLPVECGDCAGGGVYWVFLGNQSGTMRVTCQTCYGRGSL
ncbi:MAG: hypothetical protein U0840_20915 [Gemmataceae bacterium]